MNLTDLLTIYRPLEARNRNVAIFYLHGGGLLYGERNDLPETYVRMFTDAGYTLVCADYPLAPESSLEQTVATIVDIWRASIGQALQNEKLRGYCLFGRSTGANLALLLDRELRRRNETEPLAILDFYGYHDLSDPALSEPAAAYTALPEVSRAQVDAVIDKSDGAPMQGSKAARWSLYVYARQHKGAWLDFMGLKSEEAVSRWSLGADDIAALPPIFISASTGDADIPLGQSKALWRAAPYAAMHQVYYLEHDFDRDTTNPAGREAYEAALAFLERACSKTS